MTATQQAIEEFKRLTIQLNNLGSKIKSLQVGDVVVLRDNSRQTITKVQWGEATGDNSFFRWSSTFPFEIDHAAMDLAHEIVDVEQK